MVQIMNKPAPGMPSWAWRRILIYSVVTYSFYHLHELVNAPDTRVNDTIAFGLLTLVSVLVLGYTGLATAQDIAAIWTTRTARPYADPPADPVDAPPADQTVIVQGPTNIQPAPPAMPEPPR
jgi:hypothetical protein